ncbi:hypothetical protein PsorP6_003405 [Peronosclerospora sorghi]|uniref:Uncharacterized protein n=1 Tax=Peronosclerospora sorghi TaxID=230839 RepID=A0ACC0VIX9_9STRA|nr:hypothetical protein PsorP6_003405 [Peronosclerospora sorghi]
MNMSDYDNARLLKRHNVLTTAFSRKKILKATSQLDLEVLSPKVNLSTSKQHLPTSWTRKQQLERSVAFQGDVDVGDSSSDSNADDELLFSK